MLLSNRSTSTYESEITNDENTPLLNSSSSLPTVTSYDNPLLDFPGPSTAYSETNECEVVNRGQRRRCTAQRPMIKQKMS
ncbi:hypothetical protein DICVIV_09823 [Dictyocaulus viviparus]|uniref:Uncharacterized protein n=1 Tax=Dictyocaulus viviparus TaxID=29172 RepID=A0A0D8XK54_DICVI|nr:hypothetical protein DICVIV_09823 [Dictyocaulus viviparus]